MGTKKNQASLSKMYKYYRVKYAPPPPKENYGKNVDFLKIEGIFIIYYYYDYYYYYYFEVEN